MLKEKSKNKILKFYDIITNYTNISMDDEVSNFDWDSLNEAHMQIYIVYKFNIKETLILRKLICKYINNYQCSLSGEAMGYLNNFTIYLTKMIDCELELETAELLKEV